MENKDYLMRTRLIEGGLVIEDKNNHQVEMKIMTDKKCQIERKTDNYLLMENINNYQDDIEYILEKNKVKENVIIKKRRKYYKYLYELKLINLELVELKGQYIFVDKKNKRMVFKLSDFIMYDDNYISSTDIKVKIYQDSKNRLILKLNPSREWINDKVRKFPIKVDPSVELETGGVITFTSDNESGLLSNGSLARVGIKDNQAYALTINIDNKNVYSKYLQENDSTSKCSLFLELSYTNVVSGTNSVYKTSVSSATLKYKVDNNRKFKINLSKLLSVKYQTELSIPFEHINSDRALELEDDYLDIITDATYGEEFQPRLIFEYKEKNDPAIHKKEFVLDENQITYLDVHNGNFIHKIAIGTIKHNSLSLGLNLVLNSNLLFESSNDRLKKHMTKGWMTNFHQSIIKSDLYNGIMESKKIVYIDGEGYSHELKDSWYYEENGIKLFVAESSVFYDDENEFAYKDTDGVIHKVKHEYKNKEGLLYFPNQGDYDFNFEYNPTYQKRYYVVVGGKKVYIYKDENGYLHIPLFKYLVKNPEIYSAEEFIDTGLSYSQIDIINNGAYKYQLIDDVYYYDDYLISDPNIESPGEITITQFGIERKEYLYIEKTTNYEKGKTRKGYFVNEDIKSINNQIKSTEEYITNLEKNLINIKTTITSMLSSFEYQKGMDNVSKHLSNMQKKEYVEQYLETTDQINLYKDLLREYKIIKNKLVNEQYENVNDILLDTDNNMLGFNGFGRLILIQDCYGNCINVVYGTGNDQNKILSIESETEKIIFDYDSNDMLNKIVDQYGRIIELEDCSLNGYEDSLKLKYKDKEYHFINSPNIYYINDTLGKIVRLYLSDKKATKVEEYFTGNAEEKNDPFVGTQDSGNIYTYTYDNNKTTEVITKFGNDSFNKTNTYRFDGAGRLIKSVNHKNDYIIKEYNCDKIVGEYSYNKNRDLFKDLKESTIASDIIIEKEENTTRMFAYVLEHKNNDSEIEEVLFDMIVYEINEDGTYTSFSTVNKAVYDYEDIIICPIKVKRGCRSLIKSYNSTTFEESDISDAYIVRVDGTQYEYDDENHLIKSKDGISETLYEEYYNDNPTKVTLIDLQHNEVMLTRYNYDSNNRLTCKVDYLGNTEEYIYDEFGQLVEKKTYNQKAPTLCKKERYHYDKNGNMTILDGVMKDSNGNFPSTTIEYTRGLKTKIKTPSGKVVNYGYDFNNDNVLSISSEVNGVSNINMLSYKRNRLDSLQHDGFKVTYLYDKQGRKTFTLINNEEYITTEYDDNYTSVTDSVENGLLKTDTYRNGFVKKEILDEDGKLRKIYSAGKTKIFTYDEKERLVNLKSSDSYIDVNYTYDNYNNLVNENSTGNNSAYSKTYTYDDRQRIASNENVYNNKTFTSTYTYNEENKTLIDKVNLTVDEISIDKEFKYDVLERISSQSLNINNEEFIRDEFEYLCNEDNAVSLIKEHNVSFKGSLLETNTYEYDLNGNIIKVISDENETRYHYDSIGRLIREDNPLLNKTITYKYDKRGNILLRKEYEYTLEENLLNTTKIDKFTYSTSGWKDQLIKYNDEEFTYDNMGRPTKFRNMTMGWSSEGRLTSVAGKYSSIGYNIDGKIVYRREGSHPYGMEYILNDSNKILASGAMTFIYVVEKLVGFIYNGVTYYYRRNIQGDITHIYDETGVMVCKYVYDAYGRHKVFNSSLEEDVDASSVGNINPFRYRGYYYDVETQLFYCNSRYYSPELCRFISPDSIEYLDPESINGLNLYAYCGNDPVNRYDPTGHAWDVILDIGFIIWDIYNLCTNEGWKDWENWAALGLDVAFAVVPFLTGGGGQIVKLANVADDISDFNKITVVGETMTRVKTVSQFVNATDNIYDGFKAYDTLKDLGKGGKALAEIAGKADNMAWLYGKLRKGYTVIDIGIDTIRTARSSSYFFERILLNIWKYRNIWKLPYHIF